jgi:hypothetical protein
MSGGRTAFETTDFPDVFLPVTGQYKIRGKFQAHPVIGTPLR